MSMFFDEETMLWTIMFHNIVVARFSLESLASAFMQKSGF